MALDMLFAPAFAMTRPPAPLWLEIQANAPRLLAWLPGGPAIYLYGLVLATVVVSQTLPQAILLWTEPDMEPDLVEFGAESAL